MLFSHLLNFLGAHKRGFSLVEFIIVTSLSVFIIICVVLILSRYFSGEKKGFDNLSIMQEEGKFLSYFKHDLRTVIIGGDDCIPAPQLITDKSGNTTGFSFHKVDTADEFGRPVWVNVVYELKEESHGFFSMYRTVGVKGNRMKMLYNMIGSFSVQLFDQNDPNPLSETKFNEARKIRISLATLGGQLLQVKTDFYSPFLPTTHAGSPASAWLSNFRYQPFDSKTGSYLYSASGKFLEYSGVPINNKEDLIKNAEGIGLVGETNRIWGH